jgi:ectoine hydroxylase-related dioxygenase (phytanoyl-CoA dioxygenase family)
MIPMGELSPVERLKLFGYCLIEDAIPSERADALAAEAVELHEKLRGAPNLEIQSGNYETLFGLMNFCSAAMCELPVNRAVLDTVEALLGKDAQICEAGTKIVRPGYPGQQVHSDGENAQLGFAVLAMINTMWMLTDFTVENGATLIAPFSHFAKQLPPQALTVHSQYMVPVTGRKGSVFLWNGGTWHGAGPSSTSANPRIGLNAAYVAGWFNVRDKNHIKVRTEVYQKMPPLLQDKLRRQQASSTIGELANSI